MTYVIPDHVRNFRDYFKLRATPREVVEALGYGFVMGELELPRAPLPAHTEELRERLHDALMRFGFVNEAIRREFLIAPILFEIARELPVEVFIEYDLKASAQLKGTLDYLLRGSGSLLVVEAKQGDLTRAFLQMAAELAALDRTADPAIPALYGAVSLGNLWQFARLDRAEARLCADLGTFDIAHNLNDLLQVLMGILSPEQ